MVVHMKLFPNSVTMIRQQAKKNWGWEHLITWRNVAVCLILATGFGLYTKFLLQDVMQRENFPGYLSLNVPAADNVEYSEDTHTTRPKSDGLTSLAPAAIPIPLTDDNYTATQPGNGPGTMKEQNQELQDGSLASSPAILNPPRPEKFKVLVAVFIMAFKYRRREIIRAADLPQSSEYADFTLRFIMGGFTLPKWLENENATRGDLIVLQCKENLNEGKTFTFFSSLPDIMGMKYDYVMKTDDDSYVRFKNLGKHLNPLPRTDLYYGYSLPCGTDSAHKADFRVGAGYIISWDLVVWIKDSPIPRNNSIGTEDRLVGAWFNQGGVAKSRPTEKGNLFHDHPKQGGPCAQNLTMESILVHKLKSDERWEEVIAFFEKDNYNVSKSLGS